MRRDSRFRIVSAAVGAVVLAAGLFCTTRLRANATDSRFLVVTRGIQDSVTGLVWQQPDDGMVYTLANAQSACMSPWRLPTVTELFTLADPRATAAPMIDSAFTGTGSTGYWSSTAVASGSSAWNVNFGNANIGASASNSMYRVRCVQ